MKETLVILAAGMGSRYGGLKQVDTIGSNGESIIDFTIYDAIKAGFKKLILIIRKEHKDIFEQNLVSKIRPFIEVEYAFQDLKDIPSHIQLPSEREKPLGTTHALLAIRNIILDPFVICNADDYYGQDAFNKIIEFLRNDTDSNTHAMVGYQIKNTLSDNGTVTRGMCKTDNEGYLTKIVETTGIKLENNLLVSDGSDALTLDQPTSMNFWGFKTSIVNQLKNLFDNELEQGLKNNPLKYEALLPTHVGQLINEGKCKVKVLTSNDKWFGVTYKEDKPNVVNKFKQMKDDHIYPFDLWKK